MIFHLAALKDVQLSSENTLKTIQSNVIGTMNVLKLSLEHAHIKQVIAISSDKAVMVSSIYGATKFLMEGLFREYELINPHCSYRILRIGNVLHSTSSVLPKWKRALLNHDDITITDRSATRYFITREEVVDNIFECLENAQDANPYLPRMKSISMGDLLDVLIIKYGNGSNRIRVTGLKNGENMHEFLANGISSQDAEKWSVEELYHLV